MERLPDSRAGEILASLGISLPEQISFVLSEAATAAREACGRFPGSRVVLKIDSPEVLHKSDIGGVAVVAKSESAIAVAVERMAAATGRETFAVSEFIEHDLGVGSEILLGIRHTPDFGPVVVLGAGGVATEFFAQAIVPDRRIAVLAAPIVDRIGAILDGKAITPFITGGIRRQTPKMVRRELEALLTRCVAFAEQHVPQDAGEIEINPLVPTGRGLYALDLVMREPETPAPSVGPRPVEKIRSLLHPRSIAVMGVSKSRNPGRIIVENLLEARFDRAKLWVIKPGETEIAGCRCVPDVGDLPERVDLLVLTIGAAQIPEAIDRALALQKAESIIVIPGGVGEHAGSETIVESIRASIAASRRTAWKGPVVNGGNCLGINSRPARCNTIFLPEEKLATAPLREEPLSIVSQSGALAVSLQSRLAPVGARYVVSIGNQVDLTVGDYLEYFASDASLEVAAFYVEGFQPLDGRRWLEAARRMTDSGRTVILYRAGRTAAGSKASATHTAAIAGDAIVTRELAWAAGVLVADTLEDFEDLIRLSTMLRKRRAAGLRLGVLSNAGFETVAAADTLGGFTLSTLSDGTSEKVVSIVRESGLERIVTVTNPLDVNPLLADEAFAGVASALLGDDGVDAAVIGCVPLTGALRTMPDEIGAPESIVNRLAALWNQTTKPWVAVVDSGPLYDAMASALSQAGIPTFRTMDRAVRGLAKWCGSRARL